MTPKPVTRTAGGGRRELPLLELIEARLMLFGDAKAVVASVAKELAESNGHG